MAITQKQYEKIAMKVNMSLLLVSQL